MTTSLRCRSCNEVGLEKVLYCGKTPIADKILTKEEIQNPKIYPEKYYDLELAFCKKCFLTQLTEIIDPSEIYNENYPYFSSVSKMVVEEARVNANELIKTKHLDQYNLVIEIASNDGYLLKNFYSKGIPVLGIEPSLEPAKISINMGIETIVDFFSLDLAKHISGNWKKADIIIANNVFAHIPDVNDFLKGIKLLLKDDGIVVFEVHYLKKLLDNYEFDTIYHQHISYFTVLALREIVHRHGLYLNDIKIIDNYGGSIRAYISNKNKTSKTVQKIIHQEQNAQLNKADGFKDFVFKTGMLQKKLRKLLLELKASGKSIAAYGAAAKANTLLHLCKLGTDTIDYIVDKNEFKHGKYMGGNHIKIESPQKLLTDFPDYVILLAWNYMDEILEQETEYIERGGKFIIPIPELKII